LLPVSFNIGLEDHPDKIMQYARLVSSDSKRIIDDIVSGIIMGETRLITAGLHIEDIFNNRQKFKDEIMEHIGGELSHFGLRIYNSNIKELRDVEGSEYFQYLSLKSKEGAINQVY
jgi:flotillin